MEEAIRAAYPVGAIIRYRARMVAATWSLRTLLDVANHVAGRTAAERAARLSVAFVDVASEFEIPVNTLSRCLGEVSGGEVASAPVVVVAHDLLRDYLLCPDAGFMGWAHPFWAKSDEEGRPWKGGLLVPRQVAASAYAYPSSSTPNFRFSTIDAVSCLEIRSQTQFHREGRQTTAYG